MNNDDWPPYEVLKREHMRLINRCADLECALEHARRASDHLEFLADSWKPKRVSPFDR